MNPIADQTLLVIDHDGLFFSFAQRMARADGFGRVLYSLTGNDSGFRTPNSDAVGQGFERIERVQDFWEIKDECDVIAFPDVGMPGLQTELKSQGFPVFGCGNACHLELARINFKKLLADLGLEVGPYEVIRGLDALREYLRDAKECYIKISKYRGVMETFHHLDYAHTRSWLDEKAVKLGGWQGRQKFLIEQPLVTTYESGIDTVSVAGLFPKVAIQGIESKDKGYAGAVTDWKDIPEQLTGVLEALSPVLKECGHQGWISSEVRILEDGKAYFTDPTIRQASPAGECCLELIANLPGVVLHAAHGELIELEYGAQFAVQAMIDHPGDPKVWRALEVPKEAAQWVKLYCPYVEDGITWIPEFPFIGETIGSVVGIGDTLKEAIDHLKANAELLEGQDLCVHTDCLVDVLREIREGEANDLHFTDQKVPEPISVIDA